MAEQLQQLSLFNFQDDYLPTQAKKTNTGKLKWSHSKRGLLEQCLRGYYYKYYGSNKRTAKDEPLKQQLIFLKNLTNRHLAAGIILHDLIRKYIGQMQIGKTISLGCMLQQAKNRYRRQLGYVQGRKDKAIEIYYDFDNFEELIAETENKLLSAIANFVESPTFEVFRKFFSQSESLVEKNISIKTNLFSSGGKLDFAYVDGDRLVIVDWKLGGSVGSQDTLQLMSYAYFASEEFNREPLKIDLHQAHLAPDAISSFGIGENHILGTKNRIIQDLEIMNRVHDYGQRGVSGAFTPCGQPRICRLCPFQEICPKE